MASEEALIAWANRKVAEAHPDAATSPVDSLRSQVLADGLFWVRLLAAIAPEAVRAAEARGGATPAPADAQANASYAASCAHALGLPFFSRWQDLAEARPKVAMALLAALAAEDVRRTRAAAGMLTAPGGHQLLRQPLALVLTTHVSGGPVALEIPHRPGLVMIEFGDLGEEFQHVVEV